MAIHSMKASGNVSPMRFVHLVSSADNTAALAGAGESCFGISQMGTRNPPYSTLDDGYAAIDGEDLEVFGVGETTLLEIAATVVPGDRLKADASGKGTPVTANNDEYGAVATRAGVSGDLIPVYVEPNSQYGA